MDWVCSAGCAVSGALAASAGGLNLDGVIFVGVLVAVGGGSLRDSLLLSRPMFWLEEIEYFWMSVVCALFVFFFWRSFVPRGARGLWLKDRGAPELTGFGGGAEATVTASLEERELQLAEEKLQQQPLGPSGSSSSLHGCQFDGSIRTSSSGRAPARRESVKDIKRFLKDFRAAASAGLPTTPFERAGLGGSSEGLLLFYLDAVGLGAFAVIGCRNAAALSLDPAVLVLAGVCTACGGGVVRDIILGLPASVRTNVRVFHSKSPAYASCAAAAGASWLLIEKCVAMQGPHARPGGFGAWALCMGPILVAFLGRVAAVRWKIALPSWTNGMTWAVER
jgi:uncharacterized membrane protein YeiH